jgi:hypothetical protein
MAIFSRRSLQEMIYSNAQVLTEDQLKKHIDALNRANEQSVDFEWVVAIIYGLSKLGNIRHEPNLELSEKSRPLDILFDSSRLMAVEFAGDIVTVSDRGFHEENPQDAFTAQLTRSIHKRDISLQYFSYRING